MAYLKKVDSNQVAIVSTLRAIGATVQHLHTVGKGCPDILAGYRGFNYLIEIKDGDKVPSKRKLTADEALWHDLWRGQVDIAETEDAAIKIITGQ